MSAKKRRGRPISTAKGVLRRALALIQSGWTKGVFDTKGERPGRRCYCAEGALRATQTRIGPQVLARAKLKLAVFNSEQVSTSVLLSWNDRPERKKRDVIQAFQKAIRLA